MQLEIDNGWFSGAAVAAFGAVVSVGAAIWGGGARVGRLLLRLEIVEREQKGLGAAQREIEKTLLSLPGEILDRLDPKLSELGARIDRALER